jgi:hypothetical protein
MMRFHNRLISFMSSVEEVSPDSLRARSTIALVLFFSAVHFSACPGPQICYVLLCT